MPEEEVYVYITIQKFITRQISSLRTCEHTSIFYCTVTTYEALEENHLIR